MSKITEFKSKIFDFEFKPFDGVNMMVGYNGDGNLTCYRELYTSAASTAIHNFHLDWGFESSVQCVVDKFIKDTYNVDPKTEGYTELNKIFYPLFKFKDTANVFFVKYPEHKLHLKIQFKLIEDILSVVPTIQLFVFTHSPSIFGKGWGCRVINKNNLVLRKKENTDL